MDDNYTLNPGIEYLYNLAKPDALEKEVHHLWENLLRTVFPAEKSWISLKMNSGNDNEPDYIVRKLVVGYNDGPYLIDLLVVELKRPKENVNLPHSNIVASEQLNGHMRASNNPENTTIFGAVVIGRLVQFYKKLLPDGEVELLHHGPLNIIGDAGEVQQFFNYFKQNIPSRIPLEVPEST